MKMNSPHDLMPPASELLQKYQELRAYVELDDDDLQRCVAAWPLIEPYAGELIDDFYAEIMRHAESAIVLQSGPSQVNRLKHSLTLWLTELFAGNYGVDFVQNRWIVGWRHVRIGLSQMWTAVAMSRLKNHLLDRLAQDWQDSTSEFRKTASAISRMMELDLTLIQDAYHTESVANYLKTEKDFNEAIIGTTQAIVLVVNSTADGQIRRSNRYFAQIVGKSDTLPSHLQKIFDIIPDSDHPQIEQLISRQCETESCGPVVTRFIDVEKRERTVRWFARSLPQPLTPTAPVEQQCQLLVGHDITDLIEAQRRAVQQERLAAIGQTMAGLAHESRNAFQRSQAALETLALDLEEMPDALRLVERIQRANDHLLHLYQEVLLFAKPIRLDLRTCHIPELAQTTCQHLVQAGQCHSQRLQVQVEDGVQPVSADPYAVEQVLRNLLENAIAVSGEEQAIVVAIAPAWQGDRPAVRIEIRDAGPGIAPEYRERVFEPFFSTRSRGTGLGLPIARRLAEAHGGRLELVANGQGTTAVFLLPEVPSNEPWEDPENQPDHRRMLRSE